MHARVVLGVGKGVLLREVSSFQGSSTVYDKMLKTCPIITTPTGICMRPFRSYLSLSPGQQLQLCWSWITHSTPPISETARPFSLESLQKENSPSFLSLKTTTLLMYIPSSLCSYASTIIAQSPSWKFTKALKMFHPSALSRNNA